MAMAIVMGITMALGMGMTMAIALTMAMASPRPPLTSHDLCNQNMYKSVTDWLTDSLSDMPKDIDDSCFLPVFTCEDMRKVEILPQTDFWGFKISSK